MNHNISTKALQSQKKIHYLPECQSTNLEAMALIHAGNVQDGMIVLTDYQTAGRGQMGSVWQAAPGQNLTFSLIKKWHNFSADRQFEISAAVSLGISRVVTSYAGTEAKIKWPNDIYCKGGKICGILIENTLKHKLLEYSVIGIGLNVNQTNFGDLMQATSLSLITNAVIDRWQLLYDLIDSLNPLLDKLPDAKILNTYKQHLLHWLEWRMYKLADGTPFDGKIIDVLPNGLLMVETNSGTKCFDLKEIKFS